MQYTSLLETTQNTRDLGGYRKANGTLTQSLTLVRSDVQKYPSERDIAFLRDNGITTIVDMRREKDMAKALSKFADADMNLVIPCRANMEGFLRLFLEEFGNADTYLRSLGLTPEELDRIKSKL